jgi:hypothetical protein
MDERERFFVNNYSFFGESSRRRCKYTFKKAKGIKEKYKKKGVYLLPVKEFAETNAPAKKDSKYSNENAFSGIQFAVASLDQSDQDKVIELAKNIPNPNILIDQAIAIQQYRVKVGLQNEYDQGRLLDNTEVAIGNLVNMIQAKNTIEEGQEINLNVSNSITALLDEIEEDEGHDDITIDVDKENKKEQLKEIHTKSINDYLDED